MERSITILIILAASCCCISSVAQITDEPTMTPFPTVSPTIELQLPTTVPGILPFFMTISAEAPVMGMGEAAMGGMGMGEIVKGGMGSGESIVKAMALGDKEVKAMGMGDMAMAGKVDKRSERYLRNV
jgi:hypothetical protein